MTAGRRGATLHAVMTSQLLTRPRYDLPPWELYQAWRAAFEEAGQALAAWRFAPPADRAAAYQAYREAADREDEAADRWIVA